MIDYIVYFIASNYKKKLSITVVTRVVKSKSHWPPTRLSTKSRLKKSTLKSVFTAKITFFFLI